MAGTQGRRRQKVSSRVKGMQIAGLVSTRSNLENRYRVWTEQYHDPPSTEQDYTGCCVKRRLKGTRADSGGPIKRVMAGRLRGSVGQASDS